MKMYRGDLHIHTCLSPCADLEMCPSTIVKRSLEKGLNLIAVCDHNSAENAGAVLKAGRSQGLHVLPGMEINSSEEVHILALFNDEKQAGTMQDIIYSHLEGINRPDVFGEQIVVNELDEVERCNDRLLIGSTGLGLDEIVNEIHNIGGLSIASHVDRPSYSILSQLGFIPEDLALDAVELSPRADDRFLADRGGDIGGLPVIRSSDAHFPGDIGKVSTCFYMKAPRVEELRLAFQGLSDRRVETH